MRTLRYLLLRFRSWLCWRRGHRMVPGIATWTYRPEGGSWTEVSNDTEVCTRCWYSRATFEGKHGDVVSHALLKVAPLR